MTGISMQISIAAGDGAKTAWFKVTEISILAVSKCLRTSWTSVGSARIAWFALSEAKPPHALLWFNQNQTYRQEVEDGYLWSPQRKAGNALSTPSD